MVEETWSTEVPFAALLRGARNTYGRAVRDAMHAAGFEDVPKNGAFVVGALAGADLPMSRIIRQLGVSKQTAGQLVDALVVRGYLMRAVDAADRRRLTISLTPRGQAAADVAKAAIARVDAAIVDRVGPAAVATARRTLAAFMELDADRPDP